MKDAEASSRYAKALFLASQSAKEESASFQSLQKLRDLLQKDAALAQKLEHPLLTLDEKENLLAGAGSPLFRRFLSLVLQKKRLGGVPFILQAYEQIYNEAFGIENVQVKSAVPLTAEERAGLEKRLAGALKKKVALKTAVDKDVLGGLVIQMGDKIFDGSLRGQLARLGEELLATARS